MKYLRIIILVVAIFAVGAYLLQADLSSLLPSQAKPAASTSKPTLTKVQTPTRTPTRTREVPLTPTNTPTINLTQNASSFMFASAGDAQDEEANFPNTTNAIAALHPNFLIFNGDLESNGVNSYEMNRMVAGLKSAGIFNQTFLVRGNHDNKLSGSASAWENYFSTSPGWCRQLRSP